MPCPRQPQLWGLLTQEAGRFKDAGATPTLLRTHAESAPQAAGKDGAGRKPHKRSSARKGVRLTGSGHARKHTNKLAHRPKPEQLQALQALTAPARKARAAKAAAKRAARAAGQQQAADKGGPTSSQPQEAVPRQDAVMHTPEGSQAPSLQLQLTAEGTTEDTSPRQQASPHHTAPTSPSAMADDNDSAWPALN